jgi:TM2 domain-containing membrane protein YozV
MNLLAQFVEIFWTGAFALYNSYNVITLFFRSVFYFWQQFFFIGSPLKKNPTKILGANLPLRVPLLNKKYA